MAHLTNDLTTDLTKEFANDLPGVHAAPGATGRTHSLRLILLLAGIAWLVLTSSCSTLYWSQRARDGADIFTFELQTQSYGAAVRTGPVKLGLHYKSENGRGVGLRGGEVGRFVDSEFAIFLLGSDRLNDLFTGEKSSPQNDRGADDEKDSPPPARDSEPADGQASPGAVPDIATGKPPARNPPAPKALPSRLLLRRKNLNARSPFGTAIPLQKASPLFKNLRPGRFAPAHHFTGIEATVGLFFGLKVGINLGELVDFVTGFFGADIMSDDMPDLEAIRAKILETRTQPGPN